MARCDGKEEPDPVESEYLRRHKWKQRLKDAGFVVQEDPPYVDARHYPPR